MYVFFQNSFKIVVLGHFLVNLAKSCLESILLEIDVRDRFLQTVQIFYRRLLFRTIFANCCIQIPFWGGGGRGGDGE